MAQALLSEAGEAWPDSSKAGPPAALSQPLAPAGSGGIGGCGDERGVTNTPAEHLARLALAAPPGVSARAWGQRIAHASAFEMTWGAQARALGWTDAALYSLHPDAPLARLDAMGAAFRGVAGQVVAVTAIAVVLTVPPSGVIQRARRPTTPHPAAWLTFEKGALVQTISENLERG
jgi:hypothetical protein